MSSSFKLRWASIPIAVGLALAWLMWPRMTVDRVETIIAAQEIQARELASGEAQFFGTHARFTTALDSLDWGGQSAGMGIDVSRADNDGFRARIINLGSATTIQLALEVVEGRPQTSDLSRVPQSRADIAWWERTYHIAADSGAHRDTRSDR